jgi:hypothetical protein
MSRAAGPGYLIGLASTGARIDDGDAMPVSSRDAQFGAVLGFILIVGIVAIYFGFSAKLVLALLAGLGILCCASLVEGYVRAGMLGTGVILLLLVAYDLATSCDNACQQVRAQAAQQRAAQEQARMTASQPAAPQCDVNRMPYHYEAKRPSVPINPGGICASALFFDGHCLFVIQAHHDEVLGPFCKGEGARVWDKNGNTVELPVDIEYVWSADEPFDGSIGLWQPRYTKWFQ